MSNPESLVNGGDVSNNTVTPIAKSDQSSQTSVNQSEVPEIQTRNEQKIQKEPEIIPFSPESHMEWLPWLRYFEAICVEEKKDDLWKIRNIQRYLKDSALTLYIKNLLHVLHWSEFTELFLEHYSPPGDLSLTDFTSITFKIGDDLNEYYQKKTKVARNLGLDNKFILEGLTEGLPLELKRFVVTNAPRTNTEWREVVFRLNRLQPSSKGSENKSKEPSHQNQIPFRQWQYQFPQQDNRQWQTKPWNYRVPFQSPQNRPFIPQQQRSIARHNMPQLNPANQQNIHYQGTLPPAPCRVCLNIGIPHAFHWVQNCPFRNQMLNPPQFVNFSQQNNASKEPTLDQNSSNSTLSTNNSGI